MNSLSTSDLFDAFGAIVQPMASRSLLCVAEAELISLFEQRGVLLFRGFDLDPIKLKALTDRYTESYSGDAYRREHRFDSKVIRDVDVGSQAVLLHSEASFTPAWPEVIWFYCVKPPQKAGATILCDGIEVFQALSQRAKNFFLINPIRYDLDIPTGRSLPGKGEQPWMFQVPGAGDAVVQWDTGRVRLTQVRSALTEGRVAGTLCFANHLIVEMDSEPQLKRRSLIDGTELPPEIRDEIKQVSDAKTREVAWQAGDLLMIDNKRAMHGRRAYPPGDARDIVIVQSNRASFAYGATTRHSFEKVKTLGRKGENYGNQQQAKV
ncbi:MAG: TauD/TfdA family dioxygenase [Deltaproteobacteria bacterium]|nr:TauD/TfdA family dioxygenase [Deltaproteobacteria bacterium]MBI3295792.1 TauD/TfdA family dioxygenase [Deltaproteobacteria bacterium]